MMCQRIGRPPISTMGLGLTSVSSDNLVPNPPASRTTFMALTPPGLSGSGQTARGPLANGRDHARPAVVSLEANAAALGHLEGQCVGDGVERLLVEDVGPEGPVISAR